MMMCEPAVSTVVVQAAEPEAMATAEQSGVDPSRNVTVPVGVPLLLVTEAVKVTDWPTVDGFTEDATPTVAPEAAVTLKAYEVGLPNMGLLPLPVSRGAMCASAAKA